jgi:hypothetical protein
MADDKLQQKIDATFADAKEIGAKLWIKSKTLWFNTLAAAAVGLEAFGGIVSGALSVSSPKAYALVAIAIAGVNFALRWVTKESIKLNAGEGG